MAPLWKNRDFVLLRTGQAVSVLGNRISSIAFPLLVLALTHSPFTAGMVGSLETLPHLLFNLPAGAMADRWDRKRTMILCDAGRLVALVSIPLCFALHHLSLVQLGVVAFIDGSLGVFFGAAESASVSRVVPPDQLTAAYSQNEAVSRGAMMIGQPVGGVLFSLGQTIPFLCDAVSYAASVCTLAFIRTEFQEERVHSDPNMWREIREGLVWLWRQPFIRISTFLVAGSNMLFAANTLIVIVLAQRQGASPGVIGMIFSLAGFGGLLGSVAAAWIGRHLTLGQVVNGVNVLWAVLWPLVAIAPNPIALGAIFLLMVFAGPVWNVVLGTQFQLLVPDHLKGRVSSVDSLIAWGAIPVGSAVSGVLLQTVGPRPTVLMISACMVMLALAGILSPAIRHASKLSSGPTA